MPALVLTSRDEVSAIPVEDAAKQAAALLPDSRLQFFSDPGWGRVPNREGNAPLELAIEAFLAELPDSRSAPSRNVAVFGAPVHLSSREQEVLRLLAAGRSNPQIAETLVISRNTVAKHVSSILAKTGATNRVEATAYAHRHGLVGD